jgi:hypothetical protein
MTVTLSHVAPYTNPRLAVVDSTIRAAVTVTPASGRQRAIRMLADQAREACLVVEAAEQSPRHRQGGIR